MFVAGSGPGIFASAEFEEGALATPHVVAVAKIG
jgi:hypothetical protein